MEKQIDKMEEFEEIDEDRESYDIEEKLFNINSSQMSEQSWKFLGRKL